MVVIPKHNLFICHMMHKVNQIVWFVLFFTQIQAEYGINTKCITPHGDIATCLELSSCYHLYNELVSKPNNVAVKKYLRQSYCGVRKNIPLVCCGPPKSIFEECGIVEDSTNRIFGGEIVKQHFPWMAALQYIENGKYAFKCSGFLINSQFVVTAAHCLKKQVVSVHLGTSNLTAYENQMPHIEVGIVNVSYHEDYQRYLDDIGLIRIKPVNYTDNVRWICLPRANDSLPEWFTIRGWGRNDRMIETFTTALENRIRHARFNDCPLAMRRNLSWSRIICAGGEANKDSCEGDSGGALMNKTKYGWTAYGVVSFGSRDCSRGDAAIYTRIQYYLNWINRKMEELLSYDPQ